MVVMDNGKRHSPGILKLNLWFNSCKLNAFLNLRFNICKKFLATRSGDSRLLPGGTEPEKEHPFSAALLDSSNRIAHPRIQQGSQW